jgi:hypothetical protein
MAHDLSYDEVILDYRLLISAVNIGVSYAQRECERNLNELQNCFIKYADTDRIEVERMHCSKRLAQSTKELSDAQYTAYVLNEGLDRHKKSLINDMCDNPKFEDTREK